ncbi:hypothetical protein Zm00014a_043092 [Zea mays]|uniref:Uncharacterized protein n=1 Tax=Zea mays TaxID=4577 RepID=A0A3L6FWN8_MAIZE|nr:uncharacterized protein LOC100383622 isoform X1 [Zea mays]PWZ39176.1 hypothetical protein Zm00014a_043092 [Zea mays]|eukprot:XP_020403508.1 uncharacterized LOC100383622 isoform X2 [Zea mays]
MALPASSSGLFRFVSPRSRPQSTDIVAAASWGVFAGTAGLYLVQTKKGKRLVEQGSRRIRKITSDIYSKAHGWKPVDRRLQ